MFSILPSCLVRLAEALSKPLYVVGGACRDHIAGLKNEINDWDVCAPLSAGELASAAESAGFCVVAVYKNTGTVKLKCGGEEFEFTSFRTDRYVRGTHAPAEVYFTEDIVLDARRRDFKCNAVYYNIRQKRFEDPLGGIEDIKNKRVTTVRQASAVFGEDGLRLMRLCRISAETGFTPTEECIDGARQNAGLICDVVPERIFAELTAILNADSKHGIEGAQYKGLKLLHQTGVLKLILPELALGENMSQRSDYHDHDVLEHSLRAVLYADRSVRLAALLHDVGKPRQKLDTGRFACHEQSGAEITEQILARFKAGKKLTLRTVELVRWHMYDLSGEASRNKVIKFMVAHQDILDELLLLKQADYSACKDDLSVAPCVKKWKNIREELEKSGAPVTLKQLNVRGDILIGAGICPDETAKTLNFLLGECAIGNVPNEAEKLIRYALNRAKKP